MRFRLILATIIAVAIGVSLSAHVMVSPTDAKAGATQKYEVRVHNESKVAATGVDLEVPDDITVVEVAQPASGTFKTTKTGDRITGISWQVEVAPAKYVALAFTAKNPDAAKDVQWSIKEHLADGSVVEWSNKPGAKQKGSVTKIRTGS
jgi:uncharacterized protein YcnI